MGGTGKPPTPREIQYHSELSGAAASFENATMQPMDTLKSVLTLEVILSDGQPSKEEATLKKIIEMYPGLLRGKFRYELTALLTKIKRFSSKEVEKGHKKLESESAACVTNLSRLDVDSEDADLLTIAQVAIKNLKKLEEFKRESMPADRASTLQDDPENSVAGQIKKCISDGEVTDPTRLRELLTNLINLSKKSLSAVKLQEERAKSIQNLDNKVACFTNRR